MNHLLQRLGLRTLALAIGFVLIAGAFGAAPAVHAEPKAPTDHMTVGCRDGSRWYPDGHVEPVHDDEEGITYYYQCRDGVWEEVMGARIAVPGTLRPKAAARVDP